MSEKPDPAKAERAAELAFDLGIIILRNEFILIDIDGYGRPRISGVCSYFSNNRKLIRSLEDARELLSEIPFFDVYIFPDRNVQASRLFDVVESLPNLERLSISDSFTQLPFVEMWPMFDYDKEIYRPLLAKELDLTVFVEIDSAGNVYLNSKLVDSENSFRAQVRDLFEKSRTGFVLISVNRNAPCRVLVNYAGLLRNAGKIAVVPADVIADKRPRLSI